ncbi:MAG TPA: dihydroorotate dehydrogenase [Dehalococcoidia bacterium]|nr:dihydroorotate dehydrogenase [Dehalococcoidia bacterium]
MIPDLSTDLAPGHKTGLLLDNPVMVASGTLSWGTEFARQLGQKQLDRLGAVVSKAVTLTPRAGNQQPRVAETPGGMLNSIGLQNLGVDAVREDRAPIWARWKVPVLVNIAGDRADDYIAVSESLDGVPGISGFELNISCPNVDDGLEFGQDPTAAASLTAAVVRRTDLPVVVKITPNVTDPSEVAVACVDAGASAICAINTVLGMAIDTAKRKPVLARARGGLSGPAIKPIALRIVYDVASRVDVPVIGCGGVSSGVDAVEFLMAGASAVQVGTATFANPRAPLDVLDGLTEWLARESVKKVKDLVGVAL